MAKVCEKCGKGPSSGHNVSHSNRKTKRRFLPNLISKRIYNAQTKAYDSMKICAKCLKTMMKNIG